MTYILLIIALVWAWMANVTTGVLVSVISVCFLIYRAMPTIYAMRGSKAYNEGNVDVAIKYYEKAINSDRAKSSVAVHYVMMLMRIGEFKKAMKLINKTLSDKRAKDEDRMLLKQYRCLIEFKIGDKEEALEDAMEIFSSFKNTISYGLIGYLQLASGNIGEATLNLCLESYEYNKDDRDIVDNLLYACYKMEKYEEAEELIPELIEKNPNFLEGYYHGALVKLALGKKNEAKELFEKIPECTRTALTTISEEEVSELGEKLKGKK